LLHDVFICHASEDKDAFVRPLAEALRAHHIDVWYDDFVLTVGDSLREAIDRGLADSRFGIVVLSPHFFQKRWPKRELNGLVAREVAEDRQLILPIWHHIDRDEILRYSPPLADLLGVPSALGMDAVVTALLKKLRPEESPLIIARNFLISKGVSPPIVTDEWWLDLVEFKEAELRFPDLKGRRWIFPLTVPGSRPWQGARPEHRLDGAPMGLGLRWGGTKALPTDASGTSARVFASVAWPV
jgi:TIR domain